MMNRIVVTGASVRPTTQWPAGPRCQRRLWVEHWDNAGTAGRASAAAVLDRTIRFEPARLGFEPVPDFSSDQFGCKLQFADVASNSDSVVWRGDHGTRSRSAVWMNGTSRMTAVPFDPR
jgi:hypothetical protein